MNNTYGIVKPSVLNPSMDVEIWYQYKPRRSSTDTVYNKFIKVEQTDVETMFQKAEINKDEINDNDTEEKYLEGMYNLSLSASIFGSVGYYTIYIKPREFKCKIKDVGALAAYPDTRGIVIDVTTIDSDHVSLFSDDNLTGYRVEYLSTDNNEYKRQEYYRLITSGALCEPVSQNLTSANTNTPGYRYNASGSLAFLSLSPSTSPSFKGSTQKPFIGTPSQEIIISNTKFDPVCIEVEICKNDFDTITTVLTGNQIRSLDNGLLTTYNENGEIFQQQEFYTVKDSYTKTDVYDIRKMKEDIDNSANYVELMNQ